MATVKAVLNTRYKSKDETYPLIIRVSDGKRQKEYPLGEKVRKDQFKEGQVIKKHPDADYLNSLIDEKVLQAKTYLRECKQRGTPIDLSLVFAEVKAHSFTQYLKHRGQQYYNKKQIIMWRKCERFYKEWTDCFGREVYCNEINKDILTTYETYLMTVPEGESRVPNVKNTRAKKFDFLSRWYNELMTEGKAPLPNPFKKYSIGSEPVKKDKLSQKELHALEELPLKEGAVRMARDLFLFSYYCKGARFETCVTMKKAGLIAGRLLFTTNKGQKHLSTLIHPKLAAIIDRYKDNEGPYIFPYLLEELPRTTPKEEEAYRKQIDVINTTVNRGLKTAAELAGIQTKITQHISRHTFAYHLKQVSNNIHIIKDSLGHSKSDVTEKYLKELDDEFLDAELEKLYGK